jgi:hypothetical protein
MSQEPYTGPERRAVHLSEISTQLIELSRCIGVLTEKLDGHIEDESELMINLQAQSEYVTSQMQAAKSKELFWRAVLEKVAVASIWGIIALLSSVIWFAITHFVEHKGGNS